VPTTVSETDRQFLSRLHRLGDASISELCEALGVTATAIRGRLDRLEGTGLIRRESVHAGRGRPHYRYTLTEQGLRELGDNYADLALLLWEQMNRIQPAEIRGRVLSDLRAALVQRYRRSVTAESFGGRLAQLRDALSERGFDVELGDPSAGHDLPILRENNCPYHDLASRDATICDLEQAVFSEVIGTDMELTSCCQDGHHCCEFTPRMKGGS